MSKLQEYEYEDSENSTDDDDDEDEDEYNESKEVIPIDDEGYNEDNEIVIRGKHVFENASTIDEIVDKLKKEIEILLQLKNEGWELKEPVLDDYGFLIIKSTI